MNKLILKRIICYIMLLLITIAILIGLYMIDILDFVVLILAGLWIGDKTNNFVIWLIPYDDNKNTNETK